MDADRYELLPYYLFFPILRVYQRLSAVSAIMLQHMLDTTLENDRSQSELR